MTAKALLDEPTEAIAWESATPIERVRWCLTEIMEARQYGGRSLAYERASVAREIIDTALRLSAPQEPVVDDDALALLRDLYVEAYGEGAQDAILEGGTPHRDTRAEGAYNFVQRHIDRLQAKAPETGP